MKPKNKFQQQVFTASKSLPAVSETQVKWAYRNCFAHLAKRTKKGVVSCLECGYVWTDKAMNRNAQRCICPHCNTKLQIDDTKQRVFKQQEYFCIITVCKGFQVLRFFYLQSYSTAEQKSHYCHTEVIQKWIAPNGKYASIAMLKTVAPFSDNWNFQSELEIRNEKPLYNITPTCIYPRQKLLPELKRSGYSGEFYELTPFDLFYTLLTKHRAETLLKARQIRLLQYFTIRYSKSIDNYWASIKVCIRNGYRIDDVSIWLDYIDLLRFFGKDIRNAKYVCPADLNAEHDRYVAEKRKWQQKENRAKARQKALEGEAVFKEMKGIFFGIQFSDGLIEVRVLESVEEIMQEGDAMHHCLFASEYHLLPDSLLLSACIDGKRVETIEFSLSKMQVLQSRGVCNMNTEYHDRIVRLVTKNKQKIKQRMVA